MVLSKAKAARRASLRKARQAMEARKLAEQLNHSGYQINTVESGYGDEEEVKVEVKEEPEDDDHDNFENEQGFYWNTDKHDQQDTTPVLPSSSTTITHSSNKQGDYRCLLCYKTSDTTDQLTDCEESSFRTMFLMKKMFNVSHAMLEDYLKTYGSPGTWISVCNKCKVLVDKALGVQKKINQLETILRTCQQEMVSVVKRSQTAAQAHLSAKSYQNNIIRVTNEARKVFLGAPKEFSLESHVRKRTHPKASYDIPEVSSAVNVTCTSNFHASNFSNLQEFPCAETPERPLESPRKVSSTLRDVRGEVSVMKTSTTYTCNLCPNLNGMHIQSFLIHIMFHHNRPFQCSGCKIYYAHPKELNVSPLHGGNNREEDADHHVCSKDTLVEVKFKGKEVWSCDKCPKMFDVESERDLHEHQVHWNQKMMEYKYECKTCGRKFKHFNDWRLHRVLEHPEVASLSCYFCDEYFGVKSKEGVDILFNRELRRAHVKAQHGNNISKYDLKACDHCGQTFVNATKLGSHQQEAHGLPPEKTYACRICWNRFKNNTAVIRHLQSYHRVGCPEAYVCEICGHSSIRSLTLAQHKLIEHGIRPSSSNRLTVHCCKSEGCKFESITKRPFETHMIKVHGADRRYTCQFCGKAFLDAKHCREHESIHTNKTAKPFKCEICGNSFAVRNYLYIHMRLSHLNRPFASTHKKRPYRKRVTPKATSSGFSSSQHCNPDHLGPHESTAASPPPSSILCHGNT